MGTSEDASPLQLLLPAHAPSALRRLLVDAVYGARLGGRRDDRGTLRGVASAVLPRAAWQVGGGHRLAPLVIAGATQPAAPSADAPVVLVPAAGAHESLEAWLGAATSVVGASPPPSWLGLPPHADAEREATAGQLVLAAWARLLMMTAAA